MSLLAREVVHDGESISVDALYERLVPHMVQPVRDLLRGCKRCPSEASMHRAALVMEYGSASMVGRIAACLDFLDVLAEAGFSARERFEVLLEVLRGPRPGGHAPAPAVLAHATRDLAPSDVRSLVAKISDAPIRGDALTTLICALPMVRAGESPPPAADRAWLLHAPPAVLREVLEAMVPARREANLLRLMSTTNANAARAALEILLFVLDLLDTPALRQALQGLREMSRTYPGIAELHARLDRGNVEREPDGLTAQARANLGYWEEARAAERRGELLGPVAERAVGHRLAVRDAAELGSCEDWFAAPQARRDAVALAVLQAIGPKEYKLVGFDRDIAVFSPKRRKLLLSLIPGGTFEQGLTEDALARLTVLVEEAGLTEPHEEWGALLELTPALRPVRRVTVGPMLMAQKPGAPMAATELVDWLEPGPFRLPTESEWEYAARGGEADRLTWRGDVLPLAAWFRETRKLGAKAANRFGLWGFGLMPEVCADCWADSYDGAPNDGGPVAGVGPRIVRGGAAELYPWQGCGEWHLLLTAVRGSQRGWDRVVARPVVGLALSG